VVVAPGGRLLELRVGGLQLVELGSHTGRLASSRITLALHRSQLRSRRVGAFVLPRDLGLERRRLLASTSRGTFCAGELALQRLHVGRSDRVDIVVFEEVGESGLPSRFAS